MPERINRPKPAEPERKLGEDEGPKNPNLQKPSLPNELLRRMKNIDPDQAKKYRQRSGQ
ncbi:MAG: ubiquitin-like protein UBact [Chthonomonas sp.]|nr:ubiquitin-like protein UBact [Chthonomonas sp.]